MKMTKKLFMVAIATAAIALIGCAMGAGDGKGGAFGGESGGSTEQVGTKKNLTFTVEANADTEKGSPKYQRMFKQLGTSEKVQAIETVITVDLTKVTNKIALKSGTLGALDATYVVDETGEVTVRAVTGLIFDLHLTKSPEVTENGKKVTKKYYDFALIGYRPDDDGFYIEQYKDISEDVFNEATNATGFKDVADKYITESQAGFVYGKDANGNKDNTWVNTITTVAEADDLGKKFPIGAKGAKQFTVKVTQAIAGTYEIEIANQKFTYTPEKTDDTPAAWYTKDGYRIGGAAYYVNAPLGTAITANFNSKNDNTIGLEEEVEE